MFNSQKCFIYKQNEQISDMQWNDNLEDRWM